MSRLPPKYKVSKISLELDHHERNGKLCEDTKRKLTAFNNAPIEAFVLLLEYHWVEVIINQVWRHVAKQYNNTTLPLL